MSISYNSFAPKPSFGIDSNYSIIIEDYIFLSFSFLSDLLNDISLEKSIPFLNSSNSLASYFSAISPTNPFILPTNEAVPKARLIEGKT